MGFFEAFGGLALALLGAGLAAVLSGIGSQRAPASPVRRALAFCARTPASSVKL